MRLLPKKVALFLLVFPLFLSISTPASGQILLKNAKIYSMGVSGILSKGMILIRDGKIEKIGHDIPVPQGTQVIDLAGKTIIPGMVCASSSLFIEKSDLEYSGEEKPDTRILEGLNYFDLSVSQILEQGVTTVYISPVSFRSIGGLGAVVKVHSAEDGEMSVLKDNAALNIRLERLQDKKTSNVQRLTQFHRIRDLFKQAEDYRKEWAGYRTKLEKYEEEKKKLEGNKEKKPQEPQKPKKDGSLEILLEAMEGKIPVRFIVHRPDCIIQALRLGDEFGLDIILEQTEDWPYLLGELENKPVSLLSNPLLDCRQFLIPGRENGYAAGYLPVKADDFYYPYRMSERKNQEMRASWRELADSGIPFALVPPDRFPLSARFMRFYAALLLSKGVSPEFALGTVTIHAASILGVADRVGSLEEGKDADLVVLDREPLDSLAKIEMVFRDGRVIWEKNQ